VPGVSRPALSSRSRSSPRRPPVRYQTGGGIDTVAAVAWPVSSLVIGEVVTGGASASDEYVEVTNG
jgi:hypothetical protein